MKLKLLFLTIALPAVSAAQGFNFDAPAGFSLNDENPVPVPSAPEIDRSQTGGSAENPAAAMRKAYNEYKMALLNKGASNKDTLRKQASYLELKRQYDEYAARNPQKELETPSYLCQNGGAGKTCDFLPRLKNFLEGSEKVTPEDLALNFSSTDSNSLTPLRDREEFWGNLVRDILAAKSFIHVQMFGMQGDSWGQTLAVLLAEKAKSGVEVRIVADQWGARMMKLNKYASQGLFDYYKQSGVQVVFFNADPKDFKNNYHFDHRKYFIMDGKVAYNTGYTMEKHMQEEMFDLAVKVQGPIVTQLNASFLTNFVYNGGSFRGSDFNSFTQKYLPAQTGAGKQEATLAINVPTLQHRVTENYYEKISGAKKSVFVANPYFTDNRIVESLKQAVKNGARVQVILPRNPENKLNSKNAMYHAMQLDKSGVEVYLYDGPENYGRLHAKGIAVDDTFASIGSCNMDKMSLYHNFEQNIESEDPEFAVKVREHVFGYALEHSTRYKRPTGLSALQTVVYGNLTEPFDKVD